MNKDFLETKKKIDNKINEILDEEIKVYEHNEFIKNSLEELKRLSSGGKRVRGYLIKLGQNIFGKDDDSYISLAAAMEIFQTAILIHDDIIDEADERRGLDTINYKYPGHLGLSKAICVGDLGFFLSYKIINNLKVSDSVKTQLYKIYGKTLYNTVNGEIIDVELPYKKIDFHKNMDDKIIYDIYVNKTAWYTIIGPILMGSTLSNASENDKTMLIEMGINLGIAFQIKDDLLGLYSNSSIMGKTLNDIKENKQTIIYKYAIDKARDSELEFIKQNYGNQSINDEDTKKILDLFEKIGAKSYAENLVKEYTNKAISVIEKMDINNKELLIDFANYLLKRDN